jgi:hypothetical protein
MMGTRMYVHSAKENLVRVQFGFLLVDGIGGLLTLVIVGCTVWRCVEQLGWMWGRSGW